MPADFTSHRTVAKQRQRSHQSEQLRVGGVATDRKPAPVVGVASSEYEPQIVELPVAEKVL